MSAIQRKNLDALAPDEVRRFPHGSGQLAQIGQLAIGRALLEPGWRWSTDVGPIAGTPLCQIHHLQVLLAGHLAVQMADGETAEFGPNDVFDVPAGHDAWVVGDETVVILDVLGNIARFGLPADTERILATILISDIVNSTSTAARLGDAAWTQLLADHNRVVRGIIERFRGSEVSTTGDGFVATFGSALSAVRCAAAMRDEVRPLGLEVRVGVHTGEIDLLPTGIGGLAVHAAARVMTLGGSSEVIVSSITRTLVDGNGLRFEERGRQQVKGFEQPIEVYLLAT
ncbi:MAG: hypothetical protein H0X16_08420 [Chloroflexi bacterium]|nr:hypothetical protein [Chloroflexota bacterium]